MDRQTELMINLEKKVREVFDVDIRVKSRERKSVNARASFFYHAVFHFGVNMLRTSKFLGFHHATVIHSTRNYPMYRDYDGYLLLHEEVEMWVHGVPIHRKLSTVELQQRHINRLTKLCKKLLNR